MARKTKPRRKTPQRAPERPAVLRIVGGHHRGRRLEYPDREDTRPMKHRVREAIFNLVGPAVRGAHAVDLFAGAGAIGLEAVSRGACGATFVERHVPTSRLIERNVQSLGVEACCEVVAASAMMWARREHELPSTPWVVFISPPYDFYVERTAEMLDLIDRLLVRAPSESLFVVESDDRFDLARLPMPERWQTRAYPPAVISILRMSERPLDS